MFGYFVERTRDESVDTFVNTVQAIKTTRVIANHKTFTSILLATLLICAHSATLFCTFSRKKPHLARDWISFVKREFFIGRVENFVDIKLQRIITKNREIIHGRSSCDAERKSLNLGTWSLTTLLIIGLYSTLSALSEFYCKYIHSHSKEILRISVRGQYCQL